MKKISIFIQLIIFSALLFNCNVLYSQETESDLSVYYNLLNKTWTGHYVESEDSVLVHVISWQPILKSNAIKELKRVPELEFEMETYIYTNYETGHLEFLSLVSKDMISKGSVRVDDNKIIYEGTNYFSGGTSLFRKTLEINHAGELEDYYYRMKDGIYKQGHFIKYITEK